MMENQSAAGCRRFWLGLASESFARYGACFFLPLPINEALIRNNREKLIGEGRRIGKMELRC